MQYICTDRITVLIPLNSRKSIDETIQSVVTQNNVQPEILILRNGMEEVPEGVYVIRYPSFRFHTGCPIKEVFIHESGKGNALNVGIHMAETDLLCVLDADCILKQDSLWKLAGHFHNSNVAAAGGRLLVQGENGSLLERIQYCEYMKTFQLDRRLFSGLNAQCLISGAFGIFRKSALLAINGYDTDTVGEDMEIVLRLQDAGEIRSDNQIAYEPDAVCYTGVPHQIRRLFRQRDRWQRGLLDCMLKHRNMIANKKYGTLGVITMTYQFFIELLGPIFWFLYPFLFLFKDMVPFLSTAFVFFIVVQFVLTLYAAYLNEYKNIRNVIRRIPWLLITTIASLFLQTFINVARLYGMMTFHRRKHKW
ncbi:MAG: glycosyltransferase [Bulleidia sp.]